MLKCKNRPIGRFRDAIALGLMVSTSDWDCVAACSRLLGVCGILELEVGSGAGWVGAGGSGGWKQAFFDSVQTFPCGLGQRGVSADDIADHLPGGEV